MSRALANLGLANACAHLALANLGLVTVRVRRVLVSSSLPPRSGQVPHYAQISFARAAAYVHAARGDTWTKALTGRHRPL